MSKVKSIKSLTAFMAWLPFILGALVLLAAVIASIYGGEELLRNVEKAALECVSYLLEHVRSALEHAGSGSVVASKRSLDEL